MSNRLREFLFKELQNLESAGLYQTGLTLNTPQEPRIQIGERVLLNFASDNYLGWSNDERLKQSAMKAVESYGIGWSSARVVTGTHVLHRKVEAQLSEFLKTEEAALFGSAYQANMSLFENLFNDQDHLFCDFSLHPSIVDGVRLSTAKHSVFRSNDLNDLEDKLKRSPTARFRAIISEAVSPQDGKLAPLSEMIELAKKYEAIVVLDEAHSIGVVGETGRGLTEYAKHLGEVDVIMGSFGHAMGGADGAFVAGRKDIVSWIRQKSRTYLFANSLSAASLGAAQKALQLLQDGAPELAKLRENTDLLRQSLQAKGFEIVPSDHPIVSVIVRDAVVSQKMVNRLAQRGVHTLGFCYPVVPRGSARVRAQVSAAHFKKDIAEAAAAFAESK